MIGMGLKNSVSNHPKRAATAVFNPYTEEFGLLGNGKTVEKAFVFGKISMAEEKKVFLKK